MTVIKVKQQKEFSVLSNEILQNTSLSVEAIGLWAHCMSRPQDWTFHICQLCAQFKIGKEKIYKIINELIDNGYAFRGQKIETNENSGAGKRKVFSNIEYIFFPKKITQEELENLKKEYSLSDFKKCFRNGTFPEADFPFTENQPLQNKEEIQKKDNRENRGVTRNHSPPPFVHKRVKMAQEKADKLLKELGEVKFKEMLEKLDEYADINPKRFQGYGCHAAVIRKWAREDATKQQNAPKKPLEDQQLMEKLKKLPPHSKYGRIDCGPDYVVFPDIRDSHANTFKVGEVGFREKVLSQLRKMGVPIKD